MAENTKSKFLATGLVFHSWLKCCKHENLTELQVSIPISYTVRLFTHCCTN